MTATDADLMTLAEAAAAMRCGEDTVRRRIGAGTLPARRVGKRLLVSRADLDRLLAGVPVGGPPDGRADPAA